jgi:hypothetical protein
LNNSIEKINMPRGRTAGYKTPAMNQSHYIVKVPGMNRKIVLSLLKLVINIGAAMRAALRNSQ